MTQAYEKVMEMNCVEVEEVKYSEVQKATENKVDELLGELNTRYFEEATSLNETKERVQASQNYSNFSFNTYGF